MNDRMMLKNIRGLEFYGSMEDWKPKQSDKIMIRDFIRFLEVHPPLYKPFKVEAPPGIEEIVVEIRRKITELLADPEIDDRTAGILKTMRGALRKYLDTTQNIKGRKYIRDIIFPLIELRSVIGLCVGILAVMYVIDVDKNLASLIPISNDDGTDMGFAGAIPKI